MGQIVKESLKTVNPMIIGDVDGDGSVTFTDLLAILAAWGSCGDECCLADLDFDGDADFNDLLALLSNWG